MALASGSILFVADNAMAITTMQPFGNGYIIHSPNAFPTIINRFGNGWIMRGANGKSVLFASESFEKAFPESAWVEAVAERNAEEMLNLAWILEGIEKRTGEKDSKTTSAKLYQAVGKVALGQGNSAVLGQLVKLYPEAKKYQDEAKASSATRGKEGAPIAMPRIVVPVADKDGKIAPAKAGIVYLATPETVLAEFGNEIGYAKAESVAGLVNAGRVSCSPRLLATAAVELASLGGSKKAVTLKPASLLSESEQLAETMEDAGAMSFVAAIYGMDGTLKNPSKSKECGDAAKAMGATRGLRSDSIIPGTIFLPILSEAGDLINRPNMIIPTNLKMR